MPVQQLMCFLWAVLDLCEPQREGSAGTTPKSCPPEAVTVHRRAKCAKANCVVAFWSSQLWEYSCSVWPRPKPKPKLPFAKIIISDFSCDAWGWGPQGRCRLPLFSYQGTALCLMNAGFTHRCLPLMCSTKPWPAQEMQLVSCRELGSTSCTEELIHLPVPPVPASGFSRKALICRWQVLAKGMSTAHSPHVWKESNLPKLCQQKLDACLPAGWDVGSQEEGNGFNTTIWKMCVYMYCKDIIFQQWDVNREGLPFNKAAPVRKGQGWTSPFQHSVSAGADRLLAQAN